MAALWSACSDNIVARIIDNAILSGVVHNSAESEPQEPAIMSATELITTSPLASVIDGAWRLDRTRSSVAFHVRHFYGLMTVKGEFAEYDGTLDLAADAAVELAIAAASLDTKLAKRDAHLRSKDFFDVERHPQVRFVSDSVAFEGATLRVRGGLHAAGRQLELAFDAAVREVAGELEIEAVTDADHRELGMTWSPLGILRAPSKLIVRGRLVRR
jgi:polyisoprenoid-binding protein YceI